MRRSAKIYMANEVSNDSGLRCRSRSCSRASSEEDFYSPSTSGSQAPPKVSGSPTSHFGSTPGYGLKFHPRESRYRQNLDSGFLEDSNVSGEFKPSSLMTKLAEKTSDILPQDVKGNLSHLKKRWKKYNSALYSSGPIRTHSMKLNDILPIVVMVITLGSAIFTVCMLTNALNKAERLRNGKYESIGYAHEKEMEKLRVVETPIIDENGMVLGGKKASIQFAYNMRQKLEQNKQGLSKDHEKKDLELTDEEIINRLTLKVANDVMKMKVDEDTVKDQEVENSAKKERLLKKIGEFGHFGTSAVEPLDLDEKIVKSADKSLPKNSIKKVQKNPVSKNEIKEISVEGPQISEKTKKEPVPEKKIARKPSKSEVKLSEVKSDIKPEVKPEMKSEIKSEIKTEVKSVSKTEPEFKSVESDVKHEIKSEVEAELKSEIKSEAKPEAKPEVKPEVKSEVNVDIIEDDLKDGIREKREASEISLNQNPFRIDGQISPVKKEDDPFRFL